MDDGGVRLVLSGLAVGHHGEITGEYLNSYGGGEWFGPGQITATEFVDTGGGTVFDGTTTEGESEVDLDTGPDVLVDNAQLVVDSVLNVDGGWLVGGGANAGQLVLRDSAFGECESPVYVGAGISVSGDDPNNCIMNSSDASESWGGGSPASPNRLNPACGEPVMCATGDQTETQTDLTMGGRGGPFELTRVYNSQDAYPLVRPGMFGEGSSSSYTDHLSITDSSGDVTVQAANGSTSSFTYDSDTETYTPTAGQPGQPHIQLRLRHVHLSAPQRPD